MLTICSNHPPLPIFPISILNTPVDSTFASQPSFPDFQDDRAESTELLISQHHGLVRVLARQIHGRLPRHVDLEELVAAGMLGLVDAATRFSEEKSVQFKTYASFRIRGAILDLLRTTDWSPRVLRRQARALDQAVAALQARGILTPTEAEVAKELDLSLAEYQALRQQIEGLTVDSLHAERSDESGAEEIEFVPGSPTDDPLFRCLEGERRERLIDAIEHLPDRERLVLNLYYHEELTMRQVAEVMGVVESRVSQLHGSAISRLRSTLTGKQASNGKRVGAPAQKANAQKKLSK